MTKTATPRQMCLGLKNYFAGDPFAADTFRLVVFRYGPAPIEYVEMSQWGH
jgi:hypothetical protein